MLPVSKFVKVIVIGAGLAGTGASIQLTKDNIEHIILEGRDRIGGRIGTSQLDGITVQDGPVFVHHANETNRLFNFMKQQGWNYKILNSETHQFLHYTEGELSKEIITKGMELFENISAQIIEKEGNSLGNLPLRQAIEKYKILVEDEEEVIKDLFFWNFKGISNYQAAEVDYLSSRSVQYFMDQEDLIPAGGFRKLFEHIFTKAKPKEVKLNQRVTKIDYSGDIVKVYTQNNVYLANKVISSLPLGVLQSNLVQFVPKLPETHQKVIQKLGNGALNKILISVQKPFWNIESQWILFVTKDFSNKYPVLYTMIEEGKYIVCVFVSGVATKQLSQLTNEQILKDFMAFLKGFFPKQDIIVRDYSVTRWHKDRFSLDSYSFDKVGTNTEDYNTLRSSIDNKIWFVGEHCHPKQFSYTHGAFETGIWAAQEIVSTLK